MNYFKSHYLESKEARRERIGGNSSAQALCSTGDAHQRYADLKQVTCPFCITLLTRCGKLTVRPLNWQDLKSHELTPIIHNLNNWNAMQPVSDSMHNKHYHDEIAPLVKLRDSLNKAFIEKGTS